MANHAINSAGNSTDGSGTRSNPELDNEQRYMALLALTSQELPHSKVGEDLVEKLRSRTLTSEELQSLYARLDTDSAALESFLQLKAKVNHASLTARIGFAQRVTQLVGQWFNHSIAASIDWLSGANARYATAFSVMAVMATLLVWQQSQHSSLTTVVEQGFAEVNFNATDPALKSLTLPWERSQTSLGFSATPQTQSPGIREFANGLLKAKQKLLPNAEAQASSNASSGNANQLAYFALGEWNILLWAACESDQLQERDFWQRQLKVQQALMSASYEKNEVTAINKHLTDVSAMLASLSHGENPKRNARRLADELLRFREELASNAVAPNVER